MAELHKFEVVEEADLPSPPQAGEGAGFSMLVLGLKTLSQRALAAVADLFFLSSVFSAWVLWYLTPEPSVHQIVNLSIYAAFVLAANWLVRRK